MKHANITHFFLHFSAVSVKSSVDIWEWENGSENHKDVINVDNPGSL